MADDSPGKRTAGSQRALGLAELVNKVFVNERVPSTLAAHAGSLWQHQTSRPSFRPSFLTASEKRRGPRQTGHGPDHWFSAVGRSPRAGAM